MHKNDVDLFVGGGGGAVGRVVAYDTRDLWFEPRHQQEFYVHFQLHCSKDKN